MWYCICERRLYGTVGVCIIDNKHWAIISHAVAECLEMQWRRPILGMCENAVKFQCENTEYCKILMWECISGLDLHLFPDQIYFSTMKPTLCHLRAL